MCRVERHVYTRRLLFSPTVFHKKEWSMLIQIPCLRKGQIFFSKTKNKKHLWFYQQIICNWHPNARVFDWQHICFVWWTCLSTESVLLWVPTVLLFSPTFLYLCAANFIQEFLMKNKKLARSFDFTLCYIDDVISLNNSKMFPLNNF